MMISIIIIAIFLFMVFASAMEYIEFKFHNTHDSFADYLIDKYKK